MHYENNSPFAEVGRLWVGGRLATQCVAVPWEEAAVMARQLAQEGQVDAAQRDCSPVLGVHATGSRAPSWWHGWQSGGVGLVFAR